MSVPSTTVCILLYWIRRTAGKEGMLILWPQSLYMPIPFSSSSLSSTAGYDVSCVWDSDSTSDGGSASIGTTVGYGCPHIRWHHHHLPYCSEWPPPLHTHVCIMGESDVVCPNISMSVCDYSLQDIQGVLFYVPLLYSCSAMLGVLMTSVCTPVGFSHLFTVLGKVIVQPKVSYNHAEYLT